MAVDEESTEDEEPTSPWDRSEDDGIQIFKEPKLSALQRYPNPFAGNDAITRGGGLVVTGLPGIGDSVLSMFPVCTDWSTTTGKTCFLWLIWHLRRAQNLPTMYVKSTRQARLWKDNKLYHIDLSQIAIRDLKPALPRNTWCLVASNRELVDVPEK